MFLISRWAYWNSSQPISYRGLSTSERAETFINRLSEESRALVVLHEQKGIPWEGNLRGIVEGMYPSLTKLPVSNLAPRKMAKSTRLNVILYPQTALLESFILGVPTILLYDQKFTGLDSSTDYLVQILEKSGIAHFSSASAASFVDSLPLVISDWWESSEVSIARNKFLSYCGHSEVAGHRQWKRLFENILLRRE